MLDAKPAHSELRLRATALERMLAPLRTEAVLREVASAYRGRLVLVSSFGADSAVLLHLAAAADPAIPVVLLDTGRLFPETLAHRDVLIRQLGLRDVRSPSPAPAELAERDADGLLHRRDPSACCALRKAAPQAIALRGFELVVTGRKRHQAATRARLPLVEPSADGRLRLNPLAGWSEADLSAYRLVHELPDHPLEAEGYRSIGCTPCTDRVAPGEDARAGRWRGLAKTECGMHPAGLGR